MVSAKPGHCLAWAASKRGVPRNLTKRLRSGKGGKPVDRPERAGSALQLDRRLNQILMEAMRA